MRAPVCPCVCVLGGWGGGCRQEWMTTAILKLYFAIYSRDFLESQETVGCGVDAASFQRASFSSPVTHVHAKFTRNIPRLLHQYLRFI